METKIMSHITKGLLLALVVIVISLVGHVLNIDLESWFGWISMGVFILAIVWSVNYYGTQMNNAVTFGNLFAHGFKVAAVAICITFLYTLLSMYVLFPDSIDRILQKGMEQAAKDGRAMPDMSEDQMQMAKKVTTAFILAGVVLINLVVGAIGSLIGAAITKKKPQDPFGNQPM